MTFNPSIPQPNDDLSDSQPQILANFSQSDIIFGIDHYKFSDLTANRGFHNKVTTPVFVDSPPSGLPPVTTANPVFYAFQDSANVGVLQYSRGPSNTIPSPLTRLQSPSTPISLTAGSTTNVLNFTGLARALCMLYATDTAAPSTASPVAYIVWTGSLLDIDIISTGGISLNIQASGSILQLKNVTSGSLNNIYWTLEFKRLQ